MDDVLFNDHILKAADSVELQQLFIKLKQDALSNSNKEDKKQGRRLFKIKNERYEYKFKQNIGSNPRLKYQNVVRLFSGRKADAGEERVPAFKAGEQEKLIPRPIHKERGDIVPPALEE